MTGAAALLQATARDRLNRTLTYLELKSMLMDSTEKVATLQGRVATGGRLRADWALQRLLGLPLSPASPCMERPGTHTGKCSVARRSMLMRMDGAVPVDATVDPKHAGAAAETMGAAAKTTLKMGPGRRLQSA